jgi:hypothetical protein
MKWFSIIVLPAFLALAGCNKKMPPAPASEAIEQDYPTRAQPKLQSLRLWIGPEEVTAEMALTREQEQTGLMFRTNMNENAGMIFVFPQPIRAAFWMKNTILPLSVAYIDPEGAIVEIHDLEPQNTNAVVAQSDNILYVLEMNRDWFKRHRIETGTYIRSEKGTLTDTFFRRNQAQ